MSDLLKEAIADAKAVRETALQNAKMALQEAFTPQLRTQFFSLRQLYGGLFGVLLGFFIRAVLGKESEFTGPFGGVTRFFKTLVNFFVFFF